MEIKTTIDRTQVMYLLLSGLEGGCGYWARIVRYVDPPEDVDLFAGIDKNDGLLSQEVFRHAHYPMCEAGGSVVLKHEDYEHEGKTESTLDYPAIVRGLTVMAQQEPKHFGDFMRENSDATTGDVFVQCCLFGKVIFG